MTPPPTAPAADPATAGPFSIAELDQTGTVAATGDSVPFHAAFPKSGPTVGPYPIVVIGHGFLIGASQYYEYARRLASFGFVAVTADFPTPILGGDDLKYAQDLSGAIDWAVAQSATATSPLAGLVDATRCGAMGHSLGGKIAIIAASQDARIKAVLGLDPVDASSPFSTGTVVRARDRLPLTIPTAFLGETIDGTGGFLGQSCAPAADNYDVLYQRAGSPSVEVTVTGADHMSFLDDPASAGFVASVCQPAVAAHADVIGLARSYVVAFFERTLAKDSRYDDYLVGTTAQSRYVTTGLATINPQRW